MQEMQPATAKIPQLWQTFFSTAVAEKIPNKANNKIYAVYTDYESDYTGKYSLIVGSEVTNAKTVPAGLTAVAVSASKYLVFSTSGAQPHDVVNKWIEIWTFFGTTKEYARAYTADFEVYDQATPDKVDIYIAIK